MQQFDKGSFTDVPSDFSKSLWDFLNSKEALVRFDTATSLARPALQGLQEQLVEKFGEKIREDRVKKMAGRMVRQIMERHGYHLDQTGVRITDGILFSSAARYKK